MTIIYMSLLIVYVLALFSRYLAQPAVLGPGPDFVSPNKLITGAVILTFVLVSGLRHNIGDTYFYMFSYSLNNINWSYVLSHGDIGFGFLQMALQQISRDPQILVFTTGLITNVLIIVVLYRYSRLFELSIYVYITSGLFIVSMNGIRQFLAAAIVFTATKYIFEGNFKKFLLVVLFASSFHASAMILIPTYYIVRRKAWTSTTLLFLVIAIVLAIGYNQLSGALFAAIQDTQYGHYKDFSEGGANIFRVAVTAGPLLIAFFGKEKLRALFPNSDYIVNLSLLGLIFMIISTQNWIFARFDIYFGLYNLILISWVVKLFAIKQQKLIYYSILVFYFMYSFYENVVVLKLVYRSNYLG